MNLWLGLCCVDHDRNLTIKLAKMEISPLMWMEAESQDLHPLLLHSRHGQKNYDCYKKGPELKLASAAAAAFLRLRRGPAWSNSSTLDGFTSNFFKEKN